MQVWLVGKHTGSYSDYGYEIIAVCRSEERAQALARGEFLREIIRHARQRQQWGQEPYDEAHVRTVYDARTEGPADEYSVGKGWVLKVRATDTLPRVVYDVEDLKFDVYPMTVTE